LRVEVLEDRRLLVEDLDTGLVGHWRLDETAIGQAVADASGLGNPGRHVNLALPQGPKADVAVNAGAASRSLSFDGANDHVLITGNSALDLSAGKFSQSVWIKPTAGNLGFHGVLGLENGLVRRAPSIWVLDNDRLHAGFGDGRDFHSLITPSVLAVGQWNHVASTYDGASLRMYVNGMEVEMVGGFTGQKPLPQTTLNIGRVDNYFQGGIDDVRVYKIALTPSQVAALANVPLPPPPDDIPIGLVGHWRLDETTLGAAVKEETGLSQSGRPRGFSAPHGPATDVAILDSAAAPRSLSFDGVDDFVQIANSPALDFSGGKFTQSVWIKPNIEDDEFHGILGHHPALDERAPSIWVFEERMLGTMWW
jgi:hypothetical protein